MSRANWGVAAAVCVVAAIIAWAAADRYWTGNRPESGAGPATATEAGGGSQDAAGDGKRDETAGEDIERRDTGESGDDEETKAAGAGGSGTGEDVPRPETDTELQEEAESYVEQLVEPSEEPLRIDRAGAFVGRDRPLSETGDGGTGASPDAAGTVEPEASDEAQSGAGTADVPAPEESAVAAADETESAGGARQAVEVNGETAGDGEPGTQVDLPVTEQSPVTIAELLGPAEDIPPDAVFYVHTVQPENDQGIWGIVHSGILENFAEGVAVHRGESTETYQVDIPRHADEREPDSSSSFLGKLIYEKTEQSYVYNYETERIGRNPDVIRPGQEIVIISFSPEELIAIYKHFARRES